jgi:Questin oxidase-like
MSLRPATLARLEGAHRFSAVFRGYLANHLPMALVALDAMGATDAEVARFATDYKRQLEPLAAARFEIVPGNESLHLGAAEALPSWAAYFEKRLGVVGPEAVLADWSRTFARAVGADVFHGAIRTAYALESESPRELAFALAYWAAAYDAREGLPRAVGTESPAQVLAAIAHDSAHSGKRPAGRSISERITAVASSPSFARYVVRVDPALLDIDSLAGALVRAYAASGDFTLLHGVTGCHAFRILMPFFADGEEALSHLWAAVVAAYMSCGSPSVEGWGLEGDDALDWGQIHRCAAQCDDEHDVKLAYSCWREWQRRGDDLYRRVASARVCHALPSSRPSPQGEGELLIR